MFIQQADLMRGMDRAFVKEFLEIARKESYEKGNFLFRHGDSAGSFFILIRGHIKLRIGDLGHVIYVVDHTGEAFGWSSLVGRNFYSASAECVAPTKVLKFKNDKVWNVMEKYPASGYIFMKSLARLLGDRLLQGYETMPIVTQADISLSFGSGQTMEMAVN